MCVQREDGEFMMLFDYHENMDEPYFRCFFKELLPLTFINLNVSNKIVYERIARYTFTFSVFYHFGNRCLKLLNYCQTQVC